MCISENFLSPLLLQFGDFTNILISRPLRSQSTRHHKTSAYFSTRSCLWYVRIIVCAAVISACRVTGGSFDTLAQSLWHAECHHWVYSKIKSCEVEPHHHLFQTDLYLSLNLQKIQNQSWKTLENWHTNWVRLLLSVWFLSAHQCVFIVWIFYVFALSKSSSCLCPFSKAQPNSAMSFRDISLRERSHFYTKL